MRVIFLEDIPNVARTGEVREVKGGYARNYLLPKRLAVAATPRELERLESIRRKGEERRSREVGGAEALSERLEGTSVTMKARAGPRGRLYGAITSTVIAEELSSLVEGELDRRDVLLEEPIHELGSYEVEVRLHAQVTTTITLVVEGL